MNALQKSVMKLVGAPVPVELERNLNAISQQDNAGKRGCLVSLDVSKINDAVHDLMTQMGMLIVSAETLETEAKQAGEDKKPAKIHSMVLDMTQASHIKDFDALYETLHAHIGRIQISGRVVILTDADATNPTQTAIIPALEGFMRSIAKELGRIGATANLICLNADAKERALPVLQYILSPRSAFVDAQTFHVSNASQENHDVRNDGLLKGKVVIVTGAARGIGLALSEAVVREGGQLIGIDVPNNPELTKQMERLGGSAFELNVADPEAGNILCNYVKSHTGHVDVVIHNAGITRDKTIKRMNQDWWDLVMNVNIHAPMNLTQALLDQKLIREGGRVVGLSSISGVAGNAGQSNYAFTKGALAGYMAGLSKELAAQGITANTIAPGFIETEMTARIPFAIRTVGRLFNALKQGGLPSDVAELAVFLSSPNAAGVTGQNIRVCGQNLLGK